MRAGLAIVTVTPGSTAPELSVARPTISPVCTCADPAVALATSASTARLAVTAFLIRLLLGCASYWTPVMLLPCRGSAPGAANVPELALRYLGHAQSAPVFYMTICH